MVGQTIKSWTHSGIKIKIYSSMLLYSKERQIITFGTRLSKAQSSYDQKQNTIAFNRRSH